MESSPRSYQSPLREAQANQTRDLILDALTELLNERPSDEISTRDLAAVAGVAERTVYRHFPDRGALHEGLSQRAIDAGGKDVDDARSLDDVAEMMIEVFEHFEQHEAANRAAVLLNADPRRLAADSTRRSQTWRELTDRTFPDLDDDQRRTLAALTRILASSQTWLRLREEYAMKGHESGPAVSWAMTAMLNEVRRGNPPPLGA